MPFGCQSITLNVSSRDIFQKDLSKDRCIKTAMPCPLKCRNGHCSLDMVVRGVSEVRMFRVVSVENKMLGKC